MKLLLFITLFTFSLCGQNSIKYGSNDGKYLTIKDTKVYYEEYGQGIPLLLVHGGFGNIGFFQKVIPDLASKYRVIILDEQSHGRSDFAINNLSYELLAEYNSQIIDKLKLDSVYVVGSSDGAISTLILAKNRPDKIRKIKIAGANYKLSGFTKQGLEEAKNCADTTWLKNELQAWINEHQSLSSKNWKKYVLQVGQLWLKDQYFPISDLEAIKIPALVVYGNNDMFTFELGIEIHNALKKSQFCIIPNCTHDGVFWNKSELMNQLTIDIFDGK